MGSRLKNCNWEEEAKGRLCFFVRTNVKPMAKTRGRELMIKRISLITVLLFGIPGTANAYIDPSSGGLLIQILLAGLAGVGVVARLYWKSLKDRFKRPFKKNNDK